MPLYKYMVWPHLECHAQLWFSLLKDDFVQLDKTKKGATNIIRGLRKVDYLKLFILEKWQRRSMGERFIKLCIV